MQRNTEIRYYCSEPKLDYISDIKEPSSCSYTIHVNVRELCDFEEFGYSPEDAAQTVYCKAK